MMACCMIHTVSGLEVVWIGHEGVLMSRLPPVLGSFLRVSLGRFEGLVHREMMDEMLGPNLSSMGLY